MKELSEKIRAISAIAILCVVIGHSPLGQSPIASFVELFCITWPVPWFLLVSGFFYRKTLERYSVAGVVVKKCRGLVIPYFLWCAIAAILVDGHVSVETFGLSSGAPTPNVNLWYLHALIALMFFVILFREGAKLLFPLKVVDVVTVFTSICFFVNVNTHRFFGVNSTPFWFLAGYFLSCFNWIEVIKVRCSTRNVVWLIFSLFLILGVRVVWCIEHPGRTIDVVLRIFWIVGVVSWSWAFLDMRRVPQALLKISKFVFFVYCVHAIPMSWLKSAWVPLFGTAELSLECGFFFVAIFTIGLSFLCACLMHRVCPRIYLLLSGGRG